MAPDGESSNDGVVFIVDDDDAVRAALRMLVRSLGMRSRSFRSGEGFLAAYEGQRSGCVLLDVRMPGMSGYEVKQHLDARAAEIPVIFLTAQGDEDVPDRLGPVELIQKPFRDDELVRRIRELAGDSDQG